MTDLGHWTTALTVPDELPLGFLYIITNKIENKKYIGKKQMTAIRKKAPLKGKKKRRSVTIETDWKTYQSSSQQVHDDILKYGKENFTFEIVRWCDSKSELAYYEAKLQFECDALLSESYYNGIINLRIAKLKCNSKTEPSS